MTTALLKITEQGPTHQDFALEARITEELRAAYAARDRGEREAARAHMARMAELIAQRSPEQVRRMETTRGLR